MVIHSTCLPLASLSCRSSLEAQDLGVSPSAPEPSPQQKLLALCLGWPPKPFDRCSYTGSAIKTIRANTRDPGGLPNCLVSKEATLCPINSRQLEHILKRPLGPNLHG